MAKEEHLNDEAYFESIDLDEITSRVKPILDIRDRKYGFPPKTYPKCFVGSEAVKKLIDENIAAHEEDAVRIGNMMLNAGVFHHVQDAHPFENKKLFYRFLSDEDHGSVAHKPDGSAVSWADFIAPLASPENQTLSLQPEVPQRDPNLAALEQVNLAAGGHSTGRLGGALHGKTRRGRLSRPGQIYRQTYRRSQRPDPPFCQSGRRNRRHGGHSRYSGPQAGALSHQRDGI